MAQVILGISSSGAACPTLPSLPLTDAALSKSPFSCPGISAVVSSCSLNFASSLQGKKIDSIHGFRGLHSVEKRRRHRSMIKLSVVSATGPSDGVKWWEKDGAPNMMDVHSAKELTDAIAAAGEKLVVVDFYASWCGSCRALYPKLCRLAADYTDIIFLKVNFDENKPLCKSLGVKVLPFFHLYRGTAGRLDAFSCSITKLQKLKDAIAIHNTERCSIGPVVGLQIDPMDNLKTGRKDEPATAGSAR